MSDARRRKYFPDSDVWKTFFQRSHVARRYNTLSPQCHTDIRPVTCSMKHINAFVTWCKEATIPSCILWHTASDSSSFACIVSVQNIAGQIVIVRSFQLFLYHCERCSKKEIEETQTKPNILNNFRKTSIFCTIVLFKVFFALWKAEVSI